MESVRVTEQILKGGSFLRCDPHVSVMPGGLRHGLAERGSRSFGLTYQVIGAIRHVVSLRDELSCGIAHFSGLQAHFRREDRATVEMTTNAFGQVGATARTQMDAVAEQISAQLVLSKDPGARDALRDRVVPAKPEEDGTLLGAQIMRSAAVGVTHHASANLNSGVERDYLLASRALRFNHFCTLADARPLVNNAFD